MEPDPRWAELGEEQHESGSGCAREQEAGHEEGGVEVRSSGEAMRL